MKQFKLSIFLTLLMSMVGITAFAHDFYVSNSGKAIYYKITDNNNKKVAVTYCGGDYDDYDDYNTDYTGNVVIPTSVTYNGSTYSVTSIGDHAFYECTHLTSVTIPNSVKSIGDEAFCYCSGLTSIAIPNSVTTIGNDAFYNCIGLTSVTIPNSVKSIGEGAFSNCKGLTSIAVGSGNTVYDSRNNCNAIIETATNTLVRGCKNTVIPNSVTSIGDHAFSLCSDMTGITIPNSVTSIGNNAFYSCSGLTSVTIPNSVTTIGNNAFYNCIGLTSVTIPNSVKSIGEGAFSNCKGLTSIAVGSGNTVYDSRNNCNAIIETATNTLVRGCKNTVIPNSVTSIGDHAFSLCSDMTGITIPNSVTSIGNNAFYSCSGLTSVTIPNSVTTIGNNAFYNCSGLTSVTIPNSVTTIGNNAFYNCNGLTSVTIPNSVTSIEGNPFKNCYNLTSISVGNGNTVYNSLNTNGYNCNAIIETATKKLIVGCKNTSIPLSVTSIGEGAFYGCRGRTSDGIPNTNTVTSIGAQAFYGCGLTSVTIPNSVTSIGASAFSSCYSLASVTIGKSVTSIGNYAFSGCSSQISVKVYNVTPISINNNIFPTSNGTLYVPSISLDTYKQAPVWSTFRNILPFGKDFSSSDITISPIDPVTYNGSPQTPDFTVKDGTTTLVGGIDYTRSYSNNIEVGTATVTITGKGDYTGTKTANFTINPSIKDVSSLTISDIAAVTYNGSAQTPTVTVNDGSTTLTNGTDYTVAYSNNTNAGTATVTITGMGNYTGTKTANFTINAKNASNLTISSIAAVTYNGSAQTPSVTVKDGSTTLTNGTHYTVAYSNNTNAGTATVTVTGKGNYTGTKSANFTINKAALTITAKSYTINQKDDLPVFGVTYSGFKNGETNSVLTTQPTITCDATDSETAGVFDITPSGAVATNYSFSYVKGTLTIDEVTSVSIAVNSLGKGTYCSEYPLDFTGVSGIEAYIISGFDPSSGKLIRTRVWEVPAETGLFIIGTPGATFNIPVKETDFYYANLMKGITVATVIPTYEENCTNFILASNGNGGVYFTRSNGYGTTAANRAYVQIPTSLVGAREFLDIEDDNDSTTGLDGVFTPDTKEAEGDYYNLSGQKVQTPRKGIYIKNGKKIFIH